ncbi:Pup--protein ligase [Dermacoccus abyssi]|uniref:Pup--protein ligase n=1 Tax=Dermacoccus abyssi TaxID=322596 RepID=UPI002AD2DE18|nr:Pup--protein ligase [Dermacoccus abyssi]
MERRIYGLETEFGVTATTNGQRRLTPDEVSRALFRKVVAWGRSSNVFLDNGSRLYLDVGAHPEYATAECDTLLDLVAHDRAGERILDDMTSEAQERLAEDSVEGSIYVFKNNTDSAGNSYGCHENLLLERSTDMNRISEVLVAFLVSRQLITGAGKLLQRDGRTVFNLTQRAEHIWDGFSSATTRSRPIINSRDEPHADSARFRRLHVIVGDSTMSDTTTLLKVGAAHLVLRLIEAGESFPRMHLANQVKAIRDVSADPTGQAVIDLQGGTSMTALAMQRLFLERSKAFVEREGDPDPSVELVLNLWERALDAVESQDFSGVETEIEWVIKRRLLTDYAARHGLELDDPRMAQLDLTFHDIRRGRGLFGMLEKAGRARRLVDDERIATAMTTPPQTTRAKLRGDFVREARAAGRDFTVDWVHLKLNDQAGRTIMCKDPFLAEDARVDRLIDGLSTPL